MIVAALVAAPPARAQTAAELLQAFGLVGTWSPDCAGPVRVIYTVSPGGSPTVQVLLRGDEIAASEIREAAPLGPDRIKWTSVMKAWSLPDEPHRRWMPEPGETWETIMEKTGKTIRPIQSMRQDGEKILVKDGFIYDADDPPGGGAIIWHNSEKATVPLHQCAAGGI
jgi:hypothetical protein